MMRMSWALLALLAACDKAADTDAGGSDTDGGTPACDAFAFDGSLSVSSELEVPSDPIAVGLFSLNFGDEPDYSAAWARVGVAALSAGSSQAFELCLSDPADEYYQSADADDSDSGGSDGDEEFAGFLVGAWVDADADGGASDGDTVVGTGLTILLHVRGTELSEEAADLGAQFGWNLMEIDWATGDPTAIVPLTSGAVAYPLDANLLLRDPGPLTGTVESAGSGMASVGLASVSEDSQGEMLTVVDVDVSEPGATFEVAVSEPPESHFEYIPDGGVEVAAYIGVAWEDLDDDGEIDIMDFEPVVGDSASADPARAVAYIRPVDFTAGFFVAQFGGVGWQLLEGTEQDMAVIDWEQGLVLASQF